MRTQIQLGSNHANNREREKKSPNTQNHCAQNHLTIKINFSSICGALKQLFFFCDELKIDNKSTTTKTMEKIEKKIKDELHTF